MNDSMKIAIKCLNRDWQPHYLSSVLPRSGFGLAETKNFIRAIDETVNDEDIPGRLKVIEVTRAEKLAIWGGVTNGE